MSEGWRVCKGIVTTAYAQTTDLSSLADVCVDFLSLNLTGNIFKILHYY